MTNICQSNERKTDIVDKYFSIKQREEDVVDKYFFQSNKDKMILLTNIFFNQRKGTGYC